MKKFFIGPNTMGVLFFMLLELARMGNDSKSVVDEKLNVRGVENLRVIDALNTSSYLS